MHCSCDRRQITHCHCQMDALITDRIDTLSTLWCQQISFQRCNGCRNGQNDMCPEQGAFAYTVFACKPRATQRRARQCLDAGVAIRAQPSDHNRTWFWHNYVRVRYDRQATVQPSNLQGRQHKQSFVQVSFCMAA